MQPLIKRLAALEALSQSRAVRPCVIVHQYRGETIADALQAEGHEREGVERDVIIFRRDHRARAAIQGECQ